ncbi:MMPL family transporter [Demequina capsici]|uniref:MMPL family transporter n=1 Tax=Demequina capsici TaxID=3075620 RepID=A0AA96FHC8_9MICO|nr:MULTISPECIES: MMPL family transporter [unclassified Demequina]WNM25655.1 MMPL family transporter [Demequina sp. OYTSA14]WNM28550.1 MMPL family transporter [Demequina sp. PMTSA13]
MKHTLLRPVLVVLAIVAWLAIGGAGGQTFGKLSDVQENDSAAFLPSSAESTEAAAAHQLFAPTQSVPVLLVVEGGEPDVATVQTFVDDVLATPLEGDPDGRTVGDVILTGPTGEGPQAVLSDDGQGILVTMAVDSDVFAQSIGEDSFAQVLVSTLRDSWTEADTGLDGYVTGPAGLVADLSAAFAGIDGILLLVALAVVLLILLVVYRSPVLPFLVLATAMIALTGAIILVYALAVADVITLNGQSQGIMFILVVGATTDYSLLLVARYREELVRVESPYSALWTAWRRSLEPIAASAGTVVLGLLVLLLSDLKSNSSLGPAGAIGIVASFLAALTLLPALLLIGGRHARGVFWPAMPRYRGTHAPAETRHADLSPQERERVTAELEAGAGLWGRISRSVDRRPRMVWLAAAGGLAALAAFLPTFQSGGLGSRDVFLGQVESITGFEVLEQHFEAGATSPIRIIVAEDEADAALAAVQGVDGVDQASLLTASVAAGAPAGVVPDEAPLVIDGRVEIVAVTHVAASSVEATQIVSDVREAVHAIDADALVGGEAAEQLDTRLTSERDLRVILPTILAVILVVLTLLLRALVAPVLIILANVLSFGATMGLAAIVFNHVLDFPGTDPAVPLLAFVFLVALGVDYSIFLMSRAREEALEHGNREGMRRALAVTGGVITSAGIVLAATFAALGVIPLIFLAQIAFIVGTGVLIDTFVVRSLLVPGLITDVGRRSWWPVHKRIAD